MALSSEQKRTRHERYLAWEKTLAASAEKGTLHLTATLIADLEQKAKKWDQIAELIEEITEGAISSHEESYHR